MKVNIGAGKKPFPGWTNVDIQPLPGIDIVADARKLPFEDESVDLIYSCHILEHFSRKEVEDILREWHRVLKPGGTLRIAVPNFEAGVEWYRQGGTLEEVMGLLVGGQRNEYDYHGMIFDYRTLKEYLIRVGFRKAEKYDWRTTEHAELDDYSQAYLPHMDKEKGMLMSLNVEASK